MEEPPWDARHLGVSDQSSTILSDRVNQDTCHREHQHSELRLLRGLDESWKYLGTSDRAGVVVRANRAKPVIKRIVNI